MWPGFSQAPGEDTVWKGGRGQSTTGIHYGSRVSVGKHGVKLRLETEVGAMRSSAFIQRPT